MILPRFFVLEGIDGSGTSTQLGRLAEALRARGYPCVAIAQPSPGPIGQLIRVALRGQESFHAETMALLFAADRHEQLHGAGGILAQIAAGSIVLCDRYLFSSLAYQSFGADPSLPFTLNAGFPLPQALIYFRLDPKIAMERIRAREQLEIFENIDFQSRLAARYDAVIEFYSQSPMKTFRIDATLPIDEISQELLGYIIGALADNPQEAR